MASARLLIGAGVTGPAQHVLVTGALQQQSEVPQHCPSFAQAVPGKRSKSNRLSARFLTVTTFLTCSGESFRWSVSKVRARARTRLMPAREGHEHPFRVCVGRRLAHAEPGAGHARQSGEIGCGGLGRGREG